MILSLFCAIFWRFYAVYDGFVCGKFELNDFYYSFDKKEFGWGSCPYDKHKISVQVLSGRNDFPSGGAIVKCGNEKNTTNSDGIAEILLSDGYHTITVSQDNCETVKKKIFVNGDDKTITVHISAIDPAHTSTTTAVKPTESTQTVTTTTVTAEHPDKNGEYIHDGVVYKCYDDYAVVSGYTDDIPSNVVLLKEVGGLPVTEIGSFAFNDCNQLTSITISDSVTTIGNYAFLNCESITSITIPDSITNIEEGAFQNCISLIAPITIPDGVTSIKSYTFAACHSLESITIPDSVTSIGEGAFCICRSLTSITIPDNVTTIEKETFYYCSNLTSVTIPDSVTSIEDRAFWLSDLTDVYYSGTESQWNAIKIVGYFNALLFEATIHYNSTLTTVPAEQPDENGEYIYDGVIYICYDDYAEVSGYMEDLPADVTLLKEVCGVPVTGIGNWAFYKCFHLTSIEIPDSVTSIGDYVFSRCFSLKSITIPNSVISIGLEICLECHPADIYYLGTESEWNALKISSTNYVLSRVTIHYNSTGNSPAPTPAPSVMKLDSVSDIGADLRPNTLYNFYAFKDKETDDILSAENLLYIDQFTTDENGKFNIPYTPTNDQILIVGAMHSIATADINISDVVYTGSEVVLNPVVTWNGIQLTEGIDYEIDGDLSAVDIGSYKILFNGIGEFFGYTTVMYEVVCSHNFADGICTICGDTDSTVEPAVSEIILGDVNEDGLVDAVDAVDASMILAFYAYLSTGGTESDMRVWLDM